eukprot:183512-Pleurochrysis_carterae.AAC.12
MEIGCVMDQMNTWRKRTQQPLASNTRIYKLVCELSKHPPAPKRQVTHNEGNGGGHESTDGPRRKAKSYSIQEKKPRKENTRQTHKVHACKQRTEGRRLAPNIMSVDAIQGFVEYKVSIHTTYPCFKRS